MLWLWRRRMSTERSLKKALEPEVAVPLAYLIFLFSAYLSFKIPVTSRYLRGSFVSPPTGEAYILSIFAVAFFVLAVKKGRTLKIKQSSPILATVFVFTTAVVYLTLRIHPLLAILMGGGYTVLLYYISDQGDLKKLGGLVLVLAVAAAATTILKGIPILNAAAREEAAVSTTRALFHGLGVFAGTLFVGVYNRKKALSAVAILSIIGLISGFKSDAIAIIVSASIAGILLDRIGMREVSLALISVFLILTGASTFIAQTSYQIWNIPPYFYPFYRFGFTFSVFSKITDIAIPFGSLGGLAFLSTTQEIVSTSVLNYPEPHIITSTLLGPLTLDFGIPGALATAAFVGLYLGAMRKDSILRKCLYAMALTHVVILIEVGLQLSSIMFLLSMLYLSIKMEG